MANIFENGFDSWLRKGDVVTQPYISSVSGDINGYSGTSVGGGGVSEITDNPINNGIEANNILSGEIGSLLGHGKKTFTDTTAGILFGLDSDGIYKFYIGTSGSSMDWAVTTASTLTISGSLVAGEISIGTSPNWFRVDSSGNTWWGATTLASAPASVTPAGVCVFESGTIGGFTLGATSLTDTAGAVGMSSAVTGGDDIRFWAGDVTPASAEFRVYESGALVASSATITGAITATSGAIGGWNVNATSIYTGTEDHSGYTANAGDITIYSDGSDSSIHAKNFYIDTSGNLTCVNITATGTVNATGGYIGTGTALVFESQGINTGATGWIRGGMTDYNTGTGYFLGYNTSTYKFSIGNSSDVSKLLLWDGTDLIVNNSSISNNTIFGDGSDGDVTISGDTTLTSDMYYNSLTIDSTKTLTTAGYRVFVKGTLTNNGNIKWVGNNGSNGSGATGGAGGATLTATNLFGAYAGKTGGAGGNGGHLNGYDGTAGDDATKALGSNGVAGGAGGGGGNGTNGGAAGAAGSNTGTVYNLPKCVTFATMLYDFSPALDQLESSAGSGSGGGGGAGRDGSLIFRVNGSGGGGSASSGGNMYIAARKIINTGIISVAGGDGGNGADGQTYLGQVGSGGGGGGGAGDGGNMILIYGILTDSGTISVAGGAKGTGGAAGVGSVFPGGAGGNGTDGIIGELIQLQV